MTSTQAFEKQTKALIDDLKSVCANYGLGNDGNEFKIITQVFLYKFMNDKFVHEIKKVDDKIAQADNWEEVLTSYSPSDYEMIEMQLDENTARLKPEHFISNLFQRQNENNFATIFDNTLLSIAALNSDIFAVLTDGGEKIVLFENISKYVTDKRDDFCRALINKLINFSFENIFHEKFDFFATIFEYLIKDYNTNSGGKYAEYFTPHAVAKIMAKCLVTEDVQNVSCYDPSAGSGTLLMNLAHAIGEDKCTLYSQDISQKSSSLLRLNLILNNLVHSIPNIVKGNTILDPYHKENGQLKKFDYIVSNPPFKLDFSDYRDELDTNVNNERFFEGIPKVPKKDLDSMPIYQLFLQHIIFSLSDKGKAAVVVPTGFLTAKSGIDKAIREYIIVNNLLDGVVSMPSNIFANTPTSVSIVFLKIDCENEPILIEASKLGIKVKTEDKKQRVVLSQEEEKEIIEVFTKRIKIEDFSVPVTTDVISRKNYSFNPGLYFDVKIEYTDISEIEFQNAIDSHKYNLEKLFNEQHDLTEIITNNLNGLTT